MSTSSAAFSRLVARFERASVGLVWSVIIVLMAGVVAAEDAEPRWRAGEPEAFGGIEGHSAVSAPCTNGCEPETFVRVECQGGTVAWDAASLSVRGEPGRGRGVKRNLILEVERPAGVWTPFASIHREVYDWGQWVGLWTGRERMRMLKLGVRLRVTHDTGHVEVYSLSGSHVALRVMADRCYAATRAAMCRWPELTGVVPPHGSTTPLPPSWCPL